MTKVSRNAPCPCGSGKKYKRCCLQKDATERIDSIKSVDVTKNIELNKFDGNQFTNSMIFEDDLDLLSNSVIYLIKEGKYDKAEKKCIELLNKYPDVVDGFDRFAMLYEARGRNQKAAEYYKKSADFMKSRPSYDPELIVFALNKVEQLS